jgi:hypothetical protein
LPEHTSLNTSRAEAKDFNVKKYSRMNISSALEHNILSIVELLRKWRQQQPTNQKVKKKVRRI